MRSRRDCAERIDVVLVVRFQPPEMPEYAQMWCDADHAMPVPSGSTALLRSLRCLRKEQDGSGERLTFRDDRFWSDSDSPATDSAAVVAAATKWVSNSIEPLEWHFWAMPGADELDQLDEEARAHDMFQAWKWPVSYDLRVVIGAQEYVIGRCDRAPNLSVSGRYQKHEAWFGLQAYRGRQLGLLGGEAPAGPPNWDQRSASLPSGAENSAPEAWIWPAGDEEMEWLVVQCRNGAHLPLKLLETTAPVVVVNGTWREAEEFRRSGVPVERVVRTRGIDLSRLEVERW